MSSIDNFLKLKGAKEAGIIGVYLARENRYHAAQSALLKCITVHEDGKGKITPAFSDNVSECIPEFREAEASVATVRSDILAILGELGEFQTVTELGEKLRRARLASESAERELRIAISKASITEGEKAMESEVVIKASVKRDRVREEQGQVIADLEGKVARIGQILERY